MSTPRGWRSTATESSSLNDPRQDEVSPKKYHQKAITKNMGSVSRRQKILKPSLKNRENQKLIHSSPGTTIRMSQKKKRRSCHQKSNKIGNIPRKPTKRPTIAACPILPELHSTVIFCDNVSEGRPPRAPKWSLRHDLLPINAYRAQTVREQRLTSQNSHKLDLRGRRRASRRGQADELDLRPVLRDRFFAHLPRGLSARTNASHCL